MNKILLPFICLITMATFNSKAQGYELKFLRVIDTALTFTIPCGQNISAGYYVDILPVNNNSNVVTKIHNIFIDWPLLALSTGSTSCGTGGSGQFRLQPALKKDGIYTEIASSSSAEANTKFNGVYWATKGTTIAVKASMSSGSYSFLSSSFNGKIRISAMEFYVLP